MKSQTSQVARSCRIREWAAMVQECRNCPNGMSVDELCRANNITKTNYYYRFAQVRKACLDSIPSDSVEHEIISSPYGTYAYGISFDSSLFMLIKI